MINSNGEVDLHLHTNRSDGYFTPEQVVDKANTLGIKAIAIVDHDDISAVAVAIMYAENKGIEVLPGVELTVYFGNQEVHLLGYCFDYENSDLKAYLQYFKKERIKRAQRIVTKLSDLGMPISMESVLRKAGEGTVGRPHIASVLVEQGFVYSFQDAFNKLIGNGKPANVDKQKTDMRFALELIHNAGGICSIAHPGVQLSDEMLQNMIKFGVDGIEVVHPNHNEFKTRHFEHIAAHYHLLATGGSDFHGGRKGTEVLGKYKIPYSVVEQIKNVTNTVPRG